MSWAPLLAMAVMGQARALTLTDLRHVNAFTRMKSTLKKGASAVVGTLGTHDRFLGIEKIRNPLPRVLENVSRLLRTFGHGDKVEELVTAMNEAAKADLQQGKDLLVKAVQTLSVHDAKNIQGEGATTGTEFFASCTRPPLETRFLPIVMKATAKANLTFKFNDVAGKGVELGLIKRDEAHVEKCVTDTTWDGLFLMIAEEEQKIRDNPGKYGRAILSRVFGALK